MSEDEELKTAEEWEESLYPDLIIHNHHGFGSSYLKGPDDDYYNKPISLAAFESKLVRCSIMRMTKELSDKLSHRTKEEIDSNE